jgi:hypothetical protein
LGQLTFYPWLHLERRIDCPPFSLIPWRRADTNPASWDAETQATIDTILEPFKRGPTAPIREATLVQLEGHGLLDDQDNNQRSQFLEFSELVTFAGLAARRFFSGDGYCNSTNFTPIVQGFSDPGRGAFIAERRRDGRTEMFTPGPLHRQDRPAQVFLETITVDTAVLSALMEVRNTDQYGPFSNALPLFNLANTDDKVVPERAEVVLTVSAFERLLESDANERDLSARFETGFAVESPVEPAQCPRIPPTRVRQVHPVRTMWIKDLFITRGSLAHGHGANAYPAIWSVHEHLLLAAFAFPLLVKQKLAALGRYHLTDTDRTWIESFEPLAGIRPFDIADDQFETDQGYDDAEDREGWNQVISHKEMELAVREIDRQMAAADSPEPGPGRE